MTIGKITRIPLRDVWAHEALGFTTWLEQNLEALNEVLDFSKLWRQGDNTNNPGDPAGLNFGR